MESSTSFKPLYALWKPIVFCHTDFVPRGTEIQFIINDKRSIDAVRHSRIGFRLHDVNLEKDFCKTILIVPKNGLTSCDDKEIIRSYIGNNYSNVVMEAKLLECRKLEDGYYLKVRGICRMAFEDIKDETWHFAAKTSLLNEYGTNPLILKRIKEDVSSTIKRLAACGFETQDKWEAGCLGKDLENPSCHVDSIIFATNFQLRDYGKRSNNSLGEKDGFTSMELRKLTSELNVIKRWQDLADKLTNVLYKAEAKTKVLKTAKESIHEKEREMFLRMQLKAVQKELGETTGEGEDSQMDDLAERIMDANMPEHIFKVANKELKRLRYINPQLMEFTVAYNYLDCLCNLPWEKENSKNPLPSHVQQTLDNDHYGLKKIKRRIVEYIACRTLNPNKKGPILCLVGPPGVGKTSIGQSLGRALGRKLVRKSLGGIKDEAEIRGHKRTYIGALPGFIIQYMIKAGTTNPIFVLDEVDKMASDFRGDPAAALLEVLDPEQNHAFSDNYLGVGVEYDLSEVMFICTANYLEGIPPTLRDRMEILELPGYTRDEKLMIAKKFLVSKQLKETGTDAFLGTDFFTDDAIRHLIDSYTREAGVRNLERQIASVLSNVAIKIADKKEFKKQISGNDLFEILGSETNGINENDDQNMPGVVTALAVNGIEGCTLMISSCQMPGTGKIEFTGHLKDIMKESVRVAFSCAITYLIRRGMNLDFLEKTDIHVQFEENAILKDGPSAGAAITLAIISLLTGKSVRMDMALTGEINLREGGKITAVGGIKDKVLAAERAGKKFVFIPEANKKDLPDIPDNVKAKIEIKLARTLSDVVNFAFAL